MAVVYFFMVSMSLVVLGLQAADPGATPFWMVALLIGSGFACLCAFAIELRRPPEIVDEVGDQVRGVYLPKAAPVAGSETLVGRVLPWTAIFKIDKGESKGEWAMQAQGEESGVVWVPLSDLVVQNRRKDFLYHFNLV